LFPSEGAIRRVGLLIPIGRKVCGRYISTNTPPHPTNPKVHNSKPYSSSSFVFPLIIREKEEPDN
jgi:hypothetical protein